MAAGAAGSLAVVCEGEDPRLFPDQALLGFVEFGQPLHEDRRVCQLAFPMQDEDDGQLLLTGDESGRLGLWRTDRKVKEVTLLRAFELGFAPLSIAWNLSGLSAIAVGYEEEGHKPRCARLTRDFEDRPLEEAWKLEETIFDTNE